MSGIDNKKINAAYVASWKEKNPKLADIKIEGNFLVYQNEKVDISEIYMQDILLNPYTFHSITTMEAKDLFTVIKLHVEARQMKEKSLVNKVRRIKNMDENLEEINGNDSTVTVEEYFAILRKTEPLNPVEESKRNRFKDFLLMCEKNALTLDQDSRDICTEYRKELAKLYYKENPTPLEKEEMETYEMKMNNSNTDTEENGYQRSLLKAGYVDATVILVLLLNIGFIIAMALLGSK